MPTQRTRIKICGITRPEDALVAAAAGADAIGLNFWPSSSRAISVQQAKEICAAIPGFVSVIALTVDAPTDLLDNIVALPIDAIQFHGGETPAQCESVDKPYIKALRMQSGLDVAAEIERYASAQSVLLDTYKKGAPGGTGETFDWSLIPEQQRSRIVLAGGLNPDNVAQAVTEIRPWAVDVSGGVEIAPGIKDAAKIAAFAEAVNAADRLARVVNHDS